MPSSDFSEIDVAPAGISSSNDRSSALDALAAVTRATLVAADVRVSLPALATAAVQASESERYPESIALWLAAMVGGGNSAAFLPLAATWLAAGRPAEALVVLDAAATNGLTSGDIALHRCHALWAAGSRAEALIAAATMMEDFPRHAGAIETAVMLHAQHGRYAAVVDLIEQFCRNGGALCTALAAALAEAALQSGRDLSSQVTAALAAADAEGSAALIAARDLIRHCWHGFFETPATPFSDAMPSREDIRRLLAVMPPSPVVSPEAALVDGWLIDQQWYLRDGFALQRWPGILAHAPMTTSLSERRVLCAAAVTLQHRTLRDRSLTLASPFGGVWTSRFATVLHMAAAERHFGATIAWYFAEPRPSFALVLSEDQWPLAWYDPLADLVVRHPAIEDHDVLLQDRVRELKTVWLALPEAVLANLSRGERPLRTALLVGLLDYISTHVFSDLQGLQQIIDAGRTDDVDLLFVTGPEPYGPIEAILPGLAAKAIERFEGGDEVDLNARLWNNDLLPVRATGGIVGEPLSRRLIARADEQAASDWRVHLDALEHRHWPILFVSLRTHNRRWLATPAEIGAMLHDLRTRFPRLAVLWDGHSRTGADEPAAIVHEATLADAVRDELGSPEWFVSLVGQSIHDAVFAASRADLHLSAQGTSATKAFLIAGKPGVIIGPRHFGWDVRGFRDPQPPAMVPWRDAVDVDDYDAQTDFALSPSLVAERLMGIIAGLSPRSVRCGRT